MTETKKTLQQALVAALAEMPDPVKNAENPAFKRGGQPMRYADLEATLDACKPILAANGIALMQLPVNGGSGEIGVRTMLLGHGEEMDCGSFVLPMEGLTPQKGAGAITYARRYALTALFGLAQEDDDANGASVTRAADTPAATPAQDDGTPIGKDAPIIRAIYGKAKALGKSKAAISATCATQWGVEDPSELTMPQAKQLCDKLEEALAEKSLEAAGFEKDAPAEEDPPWPIPAADAPEIPF